MLVAFHLSLNTCLAQGQSIREVFKAMPDSLLPMLTTNNRLDMMDFMDANMKAKVTNKLDGETEMIFLGNDSLAIRMSEALTVEMKLQKADTGSVVVCMRRTYQTRSQLRQVVVTIYDPQTWEELSSVTTESTLLKRDEKINET